MEDRRQAAIDIFSMTNFPTNIEMLKVAVGVLYNYLGLRSVCRMYADDYIEEINNAVKMTIIIRELSLITLIIPLKYTKI